MWNGQWTFEYEQTNKDMVYLLCVHNKIIYIRYV
jgi:hypothetical protein